MKYETPNKPTGRIPYGEVQSEPGQSRDPGRSSGGKAGQSNPFNAIPSEHSHLEAKADILQFNWQVYLEENRGQAERHTFKSRLSHTFASVLHT